MKIVVDENMPLTHALFSQFGEVVALSGRNITADDLSDADVLLVRSVTKVTEELLAKAKKLKLLDCLNPSDNPPQPENKSIIVYLFFFIYIF